MEDVKSLAFVVTGAAIVILAWQRKRVFDLTCTGVFLISYLVLVLFGVLAAPWLIEDFLPVLFSDVRWQEIEGPDIGRAIWIVGGGCGLVLIGSLAIDMARRGLAPQRRRWRVLMRRPGRVVPGYGKERLYAICVVCVGTTTLLFGMRLQAFLEGFYAGYVAGDITQQYAARESMQQLGLPYYLLVFNALPFLSILCWMGSRLERGPLRRAWAWAMVAASSFFLFATFEKMSLVLYVVCLVFARWLSDLYAGRARVEGASPPPLSPLSFFKKLVRGKGAFVVVPVVLLVALFYLQYGNLLRETVDSGGEALVALSQLALTNVLGRQSMQPLMYARYFPAIEPHYGISNIGKVTSVVGMRFYSDTTAVRRYFSIYDFGSTSIGALGDFYAAFGWWGWTFCSVGLGAGLNILDHGLAQMRATLLNRTLWLFMLVFAYYLSQATVTRAISSYGGATFFVLWLALWEPGSNHASEPKRDGLP